MRICWSVMSRLVDLKGLIEDEEITTLQLGTHNTIAATHVRSDGDSPLSATLHNVQPNAALTRRGPTGSQTQIGRIERLVKSPERVRDLGEVFTPSATVQAMLDLLPSAMWQPHPAPTFLEPACGDGNFLVAILARKLDSITAAVSRCELPAGDADDAIIFHALEAVASIYAVDISIDNIIGGTPGHEVGARTRMLNVLAAWHQRQFGMRLAVRSVAMQTAQWIVDRNIQVGNMLATNADGSPSGRDRLPLLDYTWHPDNLNVAVAETTLGAVMDAGAAETTGVMSLFDSNDPVVVWAGPAAELRKAPIGAANAISTEARNGNGCR